MEREHKTMKGKREKEMKRERERERLEGGRGERRGKER